ncbi:NAD(P)/FAD-dependent oxidoreductase [Streptomyces acidicola]|uniref:NAD(P)/FAD-dependent oxidoreductase n=1 Tax=Streptomyces acidicola TaxID=2596892 RepID=UPI0038185882
MSQPEHVVVIGAGLGGVRTVEQLRNAGFQGAISLVGAEPHAPYDRPPLSKQILTGAHGPEDIVLLGADALKKLNVDMRLGVPVVALHEGVVELADGTTIEADAFVIATGATPRRLPGQPDDVHTLRTLDDSLSLRSALRDATSLLVVGGGFIGAEVASGAVGRGLKVTVLEALPVPADRAFGQEVGAVYGRLITEGGVDLRLGAKLTRFLDSRTVELADGERLSSDVVLVGIGAAPAVDWWDHEGVNTTHGIACDSSGRVLGTSGVWAVGDVAAWDEPLRGEHVRHEHWTSAADQAAIVARDIVGAEPQKPTLPYFWSDQFGLRIQGLGHTELGDSVAALHGEGLSGGAIKGTVVGYFAGDRLVAVVGFGAARWVVRYRALIAKGAHHSEVFALK